MTGAQTEFKRVRFLHILVITWLGYAAYSMGRRPLSVARAVINQDTGMTVAESGVVDTAFLIMYTVGQLLFGTIQRVTGWSARSLLSAGLAGSGASLLLLATTSSVTTMSFAWGLNGLLQAVGWASCMIVITPWLASSERGVIMGIWGTTMAVGGVLGNVVTPVAMARSNSWRGGVVAVGCIMLCISALVRAALGQHPNAHGFVASHQHANGITSMDALRRGGGRTVEGEMLAAPSDDPAASSKKSEQSSSPQHLLCNVPGVAGISVSYFCAKLVRYVLMMWLPFYFTNALGHGTGMAGVLASALDVGGIVGAIGSGVLSDRYRGGRRRTSFTMLMSGAMVMCLAGFSVGSALAVHPMYAIAVGFACGACAYGIDSVMTGSLLQDFVERQNMSTQLGAISGLVGGIGTLGSVLQGPFTVAVAGFSWEVLFGILQALTLVSVACLYRPWRLERHELHAHSPL
jgi:OPA family sugar phosphate sensor protein UhpC-like MFS transporter